MTLDINHARRRSRCLRASSFTGVKMPPRATLEAEDLVTPTAFARQLGINPRTVRSWIHRAEQIIRRKVEPLGQQGPYETYDWLDLAALEREMRHRRQQREGTAQAA